MTEIQHLMSIITKTSTACIELQLLLTRDLCFSFKNILFYAKMRSVGVRTRSFGVNNWDLFHVLVFMTGGLLVHLTNQRNIMPY